MEILWLAIIFYSIGLGLVLHFRPALMFNENGTWKEFGYQRDSRYTIFPFWLFAIGWAIVSYALAAAASWTLGGAATATATAFSMSASNVFRRSALPPAPESDTESDYESEDEEEDAAAEANEEFGRRVSETIRIPRGRKRPQTPARQPRSGYYVLDPETKDSGLRKYIYYGDKLPEPKK
jgi:hypothetical protein